jgi:hypothetical protein
MFIPVYVRSRRIGVNEFAFRIKYLEEFQTAPEALDLRNSLLIVTGIVHASVMRDCMAQVMSACRVLPPLGVRQRTTGERLAVSRLIAW